MIDLGKGWNKCSSKLHLNHVYPLGTYTLILCIISKYLFIGIVDCPLWSPSAACEWYMHVCNEYMYIQTSHILKVELHCSPQLGNSNITVVSGKKLASYEFSYTCIHNYMEVIDDLYQKEHIFSTD